MTTFFSAKKQKVPQFASVDDTAHSDLTMPLSGAHEHSVEKDVASLSGLGIPPPTANAECQPRNAHVANTRRNQDCLGALILESGSASSSSNTNDDDASSKRRRPIDDSHKKKKNPPTSKKLKDTHRKESLGALSQDSDPVVPSNFITPIPAAMGRGDREEDRNLLEAIRNSCVPDDHDDIEDSQSSEADDDDSDFEEDNEGDTMPKSDAKPAPRKPATTASCTEPAPQPRGITQLKSPASIDAAALKPASKPWSAFNSLKQTPGKADNDVSLLLPLAVCVTPRNKEIAVLKSVIVNPAQEFNPTTQCRDLDEWLKLSLGKIPSLPGF
jgi:hypothetical protein